VTWTQLFFKDALKVNDPAIPIRMNMGEDGVGFDLVHPSGEVVASMYLTYEHGDLVLYAYSDGGLLERDGEPEIITLASDVAHLLASPLDEIDDADTVNAAENALLSEDVGNKKQARFHADLVGDEDLWDDQT